MVQKDGRQIVGTGSIPEDVEVVSLAAISSGFATGGIENPPVVFVDGTQIVVLANIHIDGDQHAPGNHRSCEG